MRFHAGVDPGKEGALALLDGEGRVLKLLATPMVVMGDKPPEYDVATIARLLRGWQSAAAGLLFVTVEKLETMPAMFKGRNGKEQRSSGKSNFARGVGRAGWHWMLTALAIPHELVAPQRWQRVMHEGTPEGNTKARSVVAAQRIFPGVDLRRTDHTRKQDDGKAEALLLAEYGRRRRAPKEDASNER